MYDKTHYNKKKKKEKKKRVRHDLVTELLLLKFTLEKEMATHSSILAWRNPWAEEPDGLQSMGSQRGGHD